MLHHHPKSKWAIAIALLLLCAGAAIITSAPGPTYGPNDKAAYMDENQLAFIRPGLRFTVSNVEIAQDGTVRVRVKVTDPAGAPLDREGILTPGPVSMSVVLAHIPRNATQYVSYTTRVQTSPITGVAATQAAADSGGVFAKVADGEYTYTLRTRMPAGYDRTATHTVLVYGTRNMSEFQMTNSWADTVYHFVPDGSQVRQRRDIVATKSCNRCHDPVALHGGPRRSMEGCIVCHTPQTSDPDTGNTVDMVPMTHKIHMGARLPEVVAGGKYVIIGNQQSVHDYSKVVFPANVQSCETCHEAGTSQADAWLKPSRTACGSCHSDVNFTTGVNHAGLVQVNDNQCANCHTPEGELDFDASIKGAHRISRMSKMLPGTVFELLGVADGAPGKKPTVTFSIKDKRGNPIPPAQMTRLALVLAGPTSDYAKYVSEDARTAEGSQGVYFWTFNDAIPADSKGSYTIGIEGYRNITLLEGTVQQRVQRDAGENKVITFALDGGRVEPRRQIVTMAKCNACHGSFSIHGDNRNAIEQCVLCHNPNQTDVARRPAGQGAPETVDMRTMIHKIHTGEESDRPYVVYGNGSVRHDYSEVVYPGDRRNCNACHVNNSQNLPLRSNLLKVVEPRGLINPLGPESAACLSCHTSVAAASHALANTTQLGEACSACHGANSEFSVSRAHAR